MPIKPLPRRLVQRLRRLVRIELKKSGRPTRIYRAVGRMKNVDHRQEKSDQPPTSLTWARRVRQMNVSRNYPGVELVIKRVHSASAEKTVEGIKEKVRRHNKEFKPRDYQLLMPHAYPIGKNLVAMAKTDAPNIYEVVQERTKRGKKLFEKLQREHSITKEQLEEASGKVLGRTGIGYGNIVVLGFKKGKFIFMPLMDIA